jgi:hypothetical protein
MRHMADEPINKAEKAWFQANKIHIQMADKKEISFPIDLNRKLKDATESQLNNIEIVCNGTGLHWPDLDEDLTVMGILEGRYGTT